MIENPDVLKSLPSSLKWIGGAAGACVAGWIFLRQYLSGAKVDRTANEANVATIERLRSEVREAEARADAERERGDRLMREREEMVLKIGSLEGKVDSLSRQVEILMDMVRVLKGNS